MRTISFLYFFVISFIGFIHCQDEETHQPEGIDRRLFELLMQIISPECRLMMEAYVERQEGDISDECKQEIQLTFQTLTEDAQETQEQRQYMRSDPSDPEDAPPVPVKDVLPPSALHSAYWVIGFLILFFVVLSAIVQHVNGLLQTHFPPKVPKKLSAKKEEKLKRKGRL